MIQWTAPKRLEKAHYRDDSNWHFSTTADWDQRAEFYTMDRMSPDQRDALRQAMRERFAVHYSEISQMPGKGDEDDIGDDTPSDHTQDPDSLDTDPANEW